MIEDAGAYLALHAPFLATLAWLARTEWSSRFTKCVTSGVVLIHFITILAYFLKLGDDFAIVTYWSMYFVLPVSLLYLKLIRKPRELRRPLPYIPLAVLAVPALGFVGIILALVVSPVDFH